MMRSAVSLSLSILSVMILLYLSLPSGCLKSISKNSDRLNDVLGLSLCVSIYLYLWSQCAHCMRRLCSISNLICVYLFLQT